MRIGANIAYVGGELLHEGGAHRNRHQLYPHPPRVTITTEMIAGSKNKRWNWQHPDSNWSLPHNAYSETTS